MKKEDRKEEKQKGFFAKLLEKLDRALEAKAKKTGCCGSSGDENGKNSCCG